MISARPLTRRTPVFAALTCLLSLLAASIVSANYLDTAPGSPSSHYSSNPIKMGPPAAPGDAGTVLRTLAYHQLTSLSPNGVWDTARGAIISANGARAAFAAGYDPSRFYVINTDGSGAPLEVDVRTGTGGVNDARVDISADGSHLITVGRQGNYFTVRAVNADGSNLHPVVGIEGYVEFRLSGDGSQVFFQNPGDFDWNGQRYKAGLYAISVDNPAQMRKIVDRNDIASLYGVDPDGIWFAGGDTNYFDASRDGSRLVFSVKPTYNNARLLRVNGDGSGLAEYPFPNNYWWYVANVGISGDGARVFYQGALNPCCSSPHELGVFDFSGGVKTVLSDYGGFNTDGHIAQLSYDGSKLYYLNNLYDTDGSGRLELAIPGPNYSNDPPSIVSRYGLFLA